eukprot:9055813-Lingulodinium_polyedra.AAC.1
MVQTHDDGELPKPVRHGSAQETENFGSPNIETLAAAARWAVHFTNIDSLTVVDFRCFHEPRRSHITDSALRL